ncbi:hypothetical protein ACFSC4_22740 [Deinococcus malanensis]|nr:hypothetical protein [Deinococcus malanensis]
MLAAHGFIKSISGRGYKQLGKESMAPGHDMYAFERGSTKLMVIAQHYDRSGIISFTSKALPTTVLLTVVTSAK